MFNTKYINAEETYFSKINIRKSKKSHKQKKVESNLDLETYRSKKNSKFVKRVITNQKKKFNIHRYKEHNLPNFEEINSGKGYISEGIYCLPISEINTENIIFEPKNNNHCDDIWINGYNGYNNYYADFFDGYYKLTSSNNFKSYFNMLNYESA